MIIRKIPRTTAKLAFGSNKNKLVIRIIHFLIVVVVVVVFQFVLKNFIQKFLQILSYWQLNNLNIFNRKKSE